MILLDAFALIAFLRGEPAQKHVRVLLEGGDAAVTTVNLAEVVDVLMRRFGIALPRLRGTLEPLLDEALQVVGLEARHAWRAGELRARPYARAESALSLGDCVLLASAGPEDSVATADRALLEAAATEGVATVELPREAVRRT